LDAANNVHTRRKDALTSDPSVINLVALSPSGTPVGFAQWLSPVDRTSTFGEPLPDEVAREEEAERLYAKLVREPGEEGDRWRAGEMVRERVKGSYDRGFMSVYGGLMDVGLKEWGQGRPCWILVSASSEVSSRAQPSSGLADPQVVPFCSSGSCSKCSASTQTTKVTGLALPFSTGESAELSRMADLFGWMRSRPK
jgi:hypothetical protein